MSHELRHPRTFPLVETSRWLGPESLTLFHETLKKSHGAISCLPVEGSVIPIVEGTPDGALPDEDGWDAQEAVAKAALQQAGVKFGKKLGCGTYGCAYAAKVGNENIVVKITGDAAEAAAAQGVLTAIAEGRTTWDKLKALARLRCVYSFTEKGRRGLKQVPVYAVLQEKLAPLKAADVKFIDAHRWMMVVDHPDVVRLAQEQLGARGVDNVLRIAAARAELQRIGIFWGDVHGGNLLADSKGRWSIIDLGASNNERGVDVPALSL